MLARLIRAVALLLLAGQAIVAQAHGHAPARLAGVVAAAGWSAPAPERRDGPLDCPVCRLVAHAGDYLAADPPRFAPPVPNGLWSAPPTLAAQLHGHLSHAWRSRAPPVPLPA